MAICEIDGVYLVGKDFVDCVAGKYLSHGNFRKSTDKNRELFEWKSTLNCAETERILRHAAKSAGFEFTFFRSQALEEEIEGGKANEVA